MKKKIKKALSLFLVLAILINVSDMKVWAEEDLSEQNDLEEASNQDGWDGETTKSVYETENYRVTFSLNGYWENGFQAVIRIDNIKDTVIDNWYLNFELDNTISHIWNAELYSCEKDHYVMKNAGWNQDIAAGGSVEFGFSGNESFHGFPKIYTISGESREAVIEDFSIAYCLESDSGSEFVGEISITNNTDDRLEDWTLEFDFARDIVGIWNGVILSHEDEHYVVRHADYNANIEPGQAISFGFTGVGGETEDEPSQYKLYEYRYVADQNTDISITVHTEEFEYNEYANWYIVDRAVNQLSGTLSNWEQVEELSYVIKDIHKNIVKSDSVRVEENWMIQDFGLALGYNNLTVTADSKTGDRVEYHIVFMNFDSVNMDRTDVDLTDSDSDGLSNYYESVFGTDKYLADTDGDGLSDYEELIKTGTDPTKQDTDGNGVNDAEEDTDQDGLNNLSELDEGTDCRNFDTDGDGLSDGEEVHKYHTNPLEKDSDQDGLDDGADLALGFDPTNPDTDEDGIKDGDEVIFQTYHQEIDTSRKPGIDGVSVSLECSGYIDDQVMVMDTYDLDMRSSDVVGLIGVPVEIFTDAEFTTADIIFTYDETALGDTDENDLCLMWYDEENDNYILLEDSVLDKEQHTITYRTTHFRLIWLWTRRFGSMPCAGI